MAFKLQTQLLIIAIFAQQVALGKSGIRFDNGKNQPIKRISSKHGKCNDKLLERFGIKVESTENQKPFKAIPDELEYCKNNKDTCCTLNEIESITSKYLRSYNKLLSIFEPVEEMLTLFVGKKFYETFLKDLSGDEIKTKGCEDYTHYTDQKDNLSFNLLDAEFIDQMLREITGLTSELQMFIKRQHWFYGNLICTICNPTDQEYVEIAESKVKITAISGTCLELFDMKEIEMRLAKLYQIFLRPIANLHLCLNKNEDDKIPLENELSSMNIDSLASWIESHQKCSEEFDIVDPNCLNLCKKNLSTYSVSSDIISKFANSLEFYFPLLTGMEAKLFYEIRKLQDYPEVRQNSVEFYNLGRNDKNEDNFVLEFNEKGSNIFGNHWSKKFLHNKPSLNDRDE